MIRVSHRDGWTFDAFGLLLQDHKWFLFAPVSVQLDTQIQAWAIMEVKRCSRSTIKE
jgi:hypothetical protein